MKISDFYKLTESEKWYYDVPFVTFEKEKKVVHTTTKERANSIIINGFKSGKELGVYEKRSAVYFSDADVNTDLYARNKEGESNEGQEAGYVTVDIKGLRLLNIQYKKDGVFVHHKQFNNYVIHGELEKIPFDIDGTISFLDDGRIYEVALPVDIANDLLKQQ